jgi:itaconyl-CoA hydratase
MTVQWRGRFFDDLTLGDVFRSRIGRTITETENTWFTALTMNTNQVHFNSEYAKNTEFERALVVSTLTLAIVVGLSVSDTSEHATANLGWGEIRLPRPVFAGDTLWAESEVVSMRESRSRPDVGIVGIRTRGINQRAEVVIEFTRSFMIPKSSAPAAARFPETADDWSVGNTRDV